MMVLVSVCAAFERNSSVGPCYDQCNVTLTFPVSCPIHSNTTRSGSSSIQQCECKEGTSLVDDICLEAPPISGLIIGGVVAASCVAAGLVGTAVWTQTRPFNPLAHIRIDPGDVRIGP